MKGSTSYLTTVVSSENLYFCTMSHNHYGSPDDQPHPDMYTDPHHRMLDMYQTRSNTTSQEQSHSSDSSRSVDVPICLPGNAVSFLQSYGLNSTDLAHLAKLPEDLITVDALPNLLLQIKDQKKACTLSSSTSGEDNGHQKSTKYPLDESTRPAFPLPREQVQSWQDRWGNPRKTGSVVADNSSTSGIGNRVQDRPRFRVNCDQERHHGRQVYSSATSNCSSIDSHSISERTPRPLLSLSVDSTHRLNNVPTRKQASDFLGKVPPVFPYACILCNITALSEEDWAVHIRGTLHTSSQFELSQRYPKWDHSVESARRNESPPPRRRLSSSGEVFKVPTKRESSAFQGRIPLFFPYVCALCDITVLSKKEWTLHITGTLHAKSQFKLLQKYPGWDQIYETARYSNDDKQELQNSACRRSTPGEHRSHKGSPSPKRRHSSDKTHSFTEQRFKDRNDSRHSKESSSTKKSSRSSHLVSKPELNENASCSSCSPGDSSLSLYTLEKQELRSSSQSLNSQAKLESGEYSQSSCSPPKLLVQQSSGDTAVRKSVGEKIVATALDSDSDLEGMEVIADDEEQLQLDFKEQDPKEQDEVLMEQEDAEFPENFENCITLDELLEEAYLDFQDKQVEPNSNEPTEVASNELKEIINNPVPTISNDFMAEHLTQTNPDLSVEEQDNDNVTDSIKNKRTEGITNEPSADITTNSEQSPKQPRKTISTKETIAEEQNFKNVTNGIKVASDEATEANIPDLTYIEPRSNHHEPQQYKNPEISEMHIMAESSVGEQDSENVTDCIQEIFGKVLEVKNLPRPEDYTDLDLIKIIRRYGNVCHHVLFHRRKRGLVEMENVCDAERVAADAEKQDVALRGNVLMIKVSKKYSRLSAEVLSADSEDEENNKSDALSGNTGSAPTSETALTQPVGTEFVRPVVGYFCSLCKVIYASEEEAKDEHCRTPAHCKKVKEHKSTNGSA